MKDTIGCQFLDLKGLTETATMQCVIIFFFPVVVVGGDPFAA